MHALLINEDASRSSAALVFSLVIVVLVAGESFWLWSIVSALSWPKAKWRAAGLSKGRWVMRILFLGWIGAALYARSARRSLRAADDAARSAA